MSRVTSFDIDHTNLSAGVYISRVDGSIVTFDVRLFSRCQLEIADKILTKPLFIDAKGYSFEDFVAGIHTLEHLLATHLRKNKSIGKDVLYVGPGGCMTMFYVVMRNTVRYTCSKDGAYFGHIIKDIFLDILTAICDGLKSGDAFSEIIPGATVKGCGNPNLHNLGAAKAILEHFLYHEDLEYLYP